MSTDLQLICDGDRAIEIHRTGGGLLLRYVFNPDTPPDESPRPYAHPVSTLAGEVVTNFRPNDHRWHHGLSFTITCLSGHNFWGGGSYRRPDGYQWRHDHGRQRHVAWVEQGPNRLVHTVAWITGEGNELLLQERRTLTTAIVAPDAWTLRWQAVLENVSGRTLELGHYHSNQGLAGSHYSGLQFRGARDLLDEHGDPAIGIVAEGGLSGETAVHGVAATWMEWRGQKDLTQRRVRIRFENGTGPVNWFVRRANPLAALPFQYERDLPFAPGATLVIDHTLTFIDT
jgi:hypothetical protein